MLFTGWKVRTGKTCAGGHVNWFTNWFVCATVSLDRLTCSLQIIGKKSSQRAAQILDTTTCIQY